MTMCGSRPSDSPDEVDDERANAGADEGHADEIGGDEDQRPDDPADDAAATIIHTV